MKYKMTLKWVIMKMSPILKEYYSSRYSFYENSSIMMLIVAAILIFANWFFYFSSNNIERQSQILLDLAEKLKPYYHLYITITVTHSSVYIYIRTVEIFHKIMAKYRLVKIRVLYLADDYDYFVANNGKVKNEELDFTGNEISQASKDQEEKDKNGYSYNYLSSNRKAKR